MADIMNITLLDFFDYTLKKEGGVELNTYKANFPEIDIIYSNSFDHSIKPKECLDTLNECLSNYKDDLIVIIAGYEKELENTIFKTNIVL